MREPGERGFCAKPLVFSFFSFSLVFLRGAAPSLCRGRAEGEERDRLRNRSCGRTLPETDWRDLAQLTVPDNRIRAGIGISALCLSFLRLTRSRSLSRSLHISYSSFFSISSPSSPPASLSFSLPPCQPTPSPLSICHGQLARLSRPPQLLHPECRSPRRGPLSRRLQGVLSLHSQRDKTPEEDDSGPARDPRADLRP